MRSLGQALLAVAAGLLAWPALAPGMPAGLGAGGSPRPVVSRLIVPAAATPGSPPKVLLEVSERGVARVDAVVAVHELPSGRRVLLARLGWVRTGRELTVPWPAGSELASGTYRLAVSAHDRRGRPLLRSSADSGAAMLVVAVPPPPPPPSEPAAAGVTTVAATVALGAVFPVAGAHSFGGPENAFGAPRDGYTHQGQDILTAEGTPILAPLAGTILTTSYQAGGAGYYAVERTTVGFDFMFAHCAPDSLAVSAGEEVAPARQLCRAGQTGDATTPHLDFEMWVGGWQSASGHPINPLPYLEAWERPV